MFFFLLLLVSASSSSIVACCPSAGYRIDPLDRRDLEISESKNNRAEYPCIGAARFQIESMADDPIQLPDYLCFKPSKVKLGQNGTSIDPIPCRRQSRIVLSLQVSSRDVHSSLTNRWESTVEKSVAVYLKQPTRNTCGRYVHPLRLIYAHASASFLR